MSFFKKHLLLSLSLLTLALIGIPLTIFLSQKAQETRTRATAATTLYFDSLTTASSPAQKRVGDNVTFDIMIDPGSNIPSVIKLQIPYDATKLAPASTPFVVNSQAFPKINEGPSIQNGNIFVTVSTGSNPVSAIQTTTKVGTVKFTALAPTESTSLSFGTATKVFSLDSGDEASENVLSTTRNAFISIIGLFFPSPSINPTIILPTTLPTISVAPTLPITISPNNTSLSATVFLHGIGNAGDNANPTEHSGSNKNPKKTTLPAKALIYNKSNTLVSEALGNVTYNPSSGSYSGVVRAPIVILAGSYTVKLKIPNHLMRFVPGIQIISLNKPLTLPSVTLIAGDANNNNALDLSDYNMILDCYATELTPAKNCTDPAKKLATDLNDDGLVNLTDLNLFIRELSRQSGE